MRFGISDRQTWIIPLWDLKSGWGLKPPLTSCCSAPIWLLRKRVPICFLCEFSFWILVLAYVHTTRQKQWPNIILHLCVCRQVSSVRCVFFFLSFPVFSVFMGLYFKHATRSVSFVYSIYLFALFVHICISVMRVFADDDARSSVNSLNIQCKNVKQVDLCPNIRWVISTYQQQLSCDKILHNTMNRKTRGKLVAGRA